MRPVTEDVRACVAGLVSSQPGAYVHLANFCRVEQPTVLGWAEGRNLPKGEGLIRLYVALRLYGCRFSEWDEMSSTSQQLAKVIAFDLMSSDEVRVYVGYAVAGGVYDFILRGTAALRDRMIKIEELIMTHERQIAEIERKSVIAPASQASAKSADPDTPAQIESIALMIRALDAAIRTLPRGSVVFGDLLAPAVAERVASWLIDHS